MESQQSHSLGYTNNLYILPFDHRTGLYKIFGWTEPLTPEQINFMHETRSIIFAAIEQAVALGIPKSSTPVFTDDQYGAQVLHDAREQGYLTFLTTEKSGVPYFEFDHGEQFEAIIESFHPIFTKALVRYNPEGDATNNFHSLANLKKLSDFSHEHGYKFVIEPLIAATESQLASVNGNVREYDETIRPDLTIRMITEMQEYGINPDVWKIEGFSNSDNYKKVLSQARAHNREHVGIICLGRNETDEVVASWLRAGSQVPGVLGFAIGRTIFLDSIIKLEKGSITRDEAISTIAERFLRFYRVFKGE